jgi:hypothetical protein
MKMDILAEAERIGVGAPSGTVVKIEALSMRPDGGPVMISIEFSDGRTFRVVSAHGFQIENPTGPVFQYKWTPYP